MPNWSKFDAASVNYALDARFAVHNYRYVSRTSLPRKQHLFTVSMSVQIPGNFSPRRVVFSTQARVRAACRVQSAKVLFERRNKSPCRYVCTTGPAQMGSVPGNFCLLKLASRNQENMW